jgi:hypothetical protein
MVEHQLRSVVVLRTFGEPNRFHEGSSGVVGEVNVPRRVESICSAFTEADDRLAPRARHHTGFTASSEPSWNEGFSAKAGAKEIDLQTASDLADNINIAGDIVGYSRRHGAAAASGTPVGFIEISMYIANREQQRQGGCQASNRETRYGDVPGNASQPVLLVCTVTL